MSRLGDLESFEAFREANPEVNVLGVDLLDEGVLDGLDLKGADPAVLRRVQRVLRIDPDDEVAGHLLRRGLDSAQAIAAVARTEFVAELGAELEGGRGRAEQVYGSALAVRSRAMHLAANVHALVGSPHFRALRANHVDGDVSRYFEGLASYAEMFGSLDYCECEECGSILGPAAYLVDLLRVVDLAVTQPNPGIPEGLGLDARRPDIARLPLSCANVNDEIPYLEIVCDALEQTVAERFKLEDADAVYRQLASTFYPFDLPFDLPLSRIRRYLGARSTSLAEVYAAFSPGPELQPAQARELLGLTDEGMKHLAPSTAAELQAAVRADYGLPVTATKLCGLDLLDTFAARSSLTAAEVAGVLTQGLGPQEVFDVSGRFQIDSGKGSELELVQDGSAVTGSYDANGGTLQGVVEGFVLEGTWTESGRGGSFSLTFAVDDESFDGYWTDGLGGTGEETEWAGSRDPSTPPTAGMIPHSFFVNHVLGVREYLRIAEGETGAGEAEAEIAGQSLGTLDTVSRFVRLARALGWTWEQLDWTLMTLCPPKVDSEGNITSGAELGTETLLELARVQRLVAEHDLPLELAQALWFDLKTTGRGRGAASKAPFDRLFNNPAVIAGSPDREIYRPRIEPAPTSFPNPLYRDDPLEWTIGAAAEGEASDVVSSIPGDPAGLHRVAAALFGAGATVELTVPNLSALYRHTALAAKLGLSAAEYIALVGLLGLAPASELPETLDPDEVHRLLEAAEWISEAGLSPAQLGYLLGGEPGPGVSVGYDPAQVPAFLKSLAQALEPALVGAATFVSQLVDAPTAAAVLQPLVAQGFVDPYGVVRLNALEQPPDLSALADYAPQVGSLGPAQENDVVDRLLAAQRQQEGLLGSQLAGLFGIAPATAETLLGIASWFGPPEPVAPFVSAPLFSAAAAKVEVDGALDAEAVRKRFAKKGIALSEPAIDPLTVSSWRVSGEVAGAAATFAAVSADLAAVAFYEVAAPGQPCSLLFEAAGEAVLLGGELNPEKVAAAFEANGIELGEPEVESLVAPTAWRIVDGAGGALYGAISFVEGGKARIAFTGPAAAEPVAPAPAEELGALSRLLALQTGLSASNAVTAALIAAPAAFGQQRAWPLTREAVEAVHAYSTLTAAFDDPTDALAGYLADASRTLAQLVAIAGWEEATATFLCEQLFGSAEAPATVAEVARLQRVFALARRVGCDARLLCALYASREMAMGEWETAGSLAGSLLQALRASTPDSAWPSTLVALEAPTLDARRDALAPTAIWKLGEEFEDIASERTLYEFLLLDVEMAGCAQISRVREALNAVQLYLQRCRLGLELEAPIDRSNLPDVWWEWLLDFRVWQANREVFLYPENYLDPGLRGNRTELFKELQNALLQGEVSPDSVEDLFHDYLDGLAEIAGLQPVASHHALVRDQEKGDVDTLFLFSRTATQPYRFHYATRQRLAECEERSGEVWSEWEPVEITINSPTVTPVYAFGRLYVVWVETEKKLEQDGSGDPARRYAVTQATIKLSYRSPSGTWMQPQTVFDGGIVDVRPESGMPPPKSLYGPFADLFSDPEEAWWSTVGAVRVPGESLPGGRPESERLYLYYGPLLDASWGSKGEPGPGSGIQAAISFAETMYDGYFVATQLAGLKLDGRTPLLPSLVLDSTLSPAALTFENQYALAQPDTRSETSPPTFYPGLMASSLVVTPDRETVYNEYVTGSTALTVAATPPGLPLRKEAFVSDLVTVAQSAAFFTALCKEPGALIDAEGKVKAAAANVTVAMLKSFLSAVDPTVSVEAVREIRETLLVGLYGAPVLFGGASAQNALVTAVGNQPGMFLFQNGVENFLVEARDPGEGGARFERMDAALKVEATTAALTPHSFVSRDITPEASVKFYEFLAREPGAPIGRNGVVVAKYTAKLTGPKLAEVLKVDLGRGLQVLDVLLGSAGPAGLTYGADGFGGEDTLYSLQFEVTRISTDVIPKLSRALYAGGIEELLALPRQQLPVDVELPFSGLEPTTASVHGEAGTPALRPPATLFGDQVDFDGPYGVYYWELFFHAPLLIADILRGNRQFQEAQRWYQFVFDPTLPPQPLTEEAFAALLPDDVPPGDAGSIYLALGKAGWIAEGAVTGAALAATAKEVGTAAGVSLTQGEELLNLLLNQYTVTDATRFWRFQPFRNRTLESLREELQNCAQIAAYDDEPFEPHAIARLRIGAYEKSVVMAYVSNLLDWGDQEFTQYTWESVTAARMLYGYALGLLGERPVDTGPCEERFPATFADILASYGGEPKEIPQFLIDMENALAGGQATGPMLAAAGKPYNDLGGVFCVPENTQLAGLWDRVEDRLYKLSHCMNIDGERESLALWEPPLNPADLLRGGAPGGDLLGLASQLQPAVPNYRFAVMIERALETTETVRSFGGALLSALERHDAEQLAQLRAAQEVGVLGMVTAVRQRAVEEAEDQLAAIAESLAGAEYRVGYYDALIKAALNAAEIASLALTGAALTAKGVSVPIQWMSIPGYLAPNIFGLSTGGMEWGSAIAAGAQVASTVSEVLSQSATIAEMVGSNQRREEEWELQLKVAEYEVAELKKQIAAVDSRLAAARQELAINEREVADAQAVETLLNTRFTNEDLYAWMTARLSKVYFQAFRLAQDLALAAQTAYRFELDRDDEFLAFSNWDDLRQGLLAGDGLLLELRQLQRAYLEDDSRRLEIEKTVSLRQTFPLAFYGFKWGHGEGAEGDRRGQLDFTLSEALFDFDFPGHYDRKIKSISVSLPSVIGPYQDFHVTLTQNSNLVVLEPDPRAVEYAVERTAPQPGEGAAPAGTVRENWTPNQSVAISRGTDDSGLFQLDFRDERYLPFEGTGAVSSWTLSMPPETNRIDFDAVSDVVLRIRYCARDGGAELASQVKRLYSGAGERYSYLNAAPFTLASAYSAQWAELFAAPPVDGKQTIAFPVAANAVLPNLAGVKLHAAMVQLELADGAAASDEAGETFLTLQVDGEPAEPLPIPISENFGEIGPDAVGPLGPKFAGATWSLAFDLAAAPEEILGEDGALDPEKLRDLAVVVVYSASPFASSPSPRTKEVRQ